MTLKRTITKETRVGQIVRSNSDSSLETSLTIALKHLQAEVQALAATVKTINSDGQSTASGRVLLSLVNESGVSRHNGEVVVMRPGARAFDVTAGHDDMDVIGVIFSDSADGESPAVAAGATGSICSSGIANAVVDADWAPVSIGDGLVSHIVAGVAVKADPDCDNAVFATALEALPSGRENIAVMVHGAMGPIYRRIEEMKKKIAAMAVAPGYFVPVYSDGSGMALSGCVVSATAWQSQDMSVATGHWTVSYGSSGLPVGLVRSFFGDGGFGAATVRKVIEYQQGRIAAVITQLTDVG